MHEWELHMPLYLNISWLRYIAQLQIKSLAHFIYVGPQAELGIENYTQVTGLFGGHDFLPIEIDAKLGDCKGFDMFDTSSISVLSALSSSKFDVIKERIIARHLSMSETQVLSSK